MGIYIQYILHSLVLIFDPKGGGGVWGGGVYSDWMLFEFFMKYIFLEKQFFLTSCFFFAFYEKKFCGGGGLNRDIDTSPRVEREGGVSF